MRTFEVYVDGDMKKYFYNQYMPQSQTVKRFHLEIATNDSGNPKVVQVPIDDGEFTVSLPKPVPRWSY